MSRLQQYIREYQGEIDYSSTRLKAIDPDKARQILKSKCSKSLDQLDKGNYIQRWSAAARQTEVGFLDASKMPDRLSRNTLNYYTQIINNDPSWKKFPRRQVICTLKLNSKLITDSTEELMIFPYNTTKIGICSKDDMWDSFPRLKSFGVSARGYNDFIRLLLNLGEKGPSYDESLGIFKKACKTFDKDIDNIGGIGAIKQGLINKGYSLSVQSLDGYNGDLYKLILQYYNPYGFNLVKPATYKGNYNAELWFEGPAVFINASVVEHYLGAYIE